MKEQVIHYGRSLLIDEWNVTTLMQMIAWLSRITINIDVAINIQVSIHLICSLRCIPLEVMLDFNY